VFSQPQDLKENIAKLYEHLRCKTEGVYAEAGVKECILDADLAGVFAHEAIGHTTEADLVLGGSIAGEYIGKQVGSDLVNMVDFANTAFGDTCPVPVYVDDEGTIARDAVLIEKGVLKGFMHNRETAGHFEAALTGNAKAYRFSDEPIIRMRNTTVLPGDSSLEEMIASIDNGYYLLRFNNGQADSTSEFMFGINLGYEIRNGKIGNAIRDTTISGVAFDTLKTVSMISKDMSWSCAGMCGKKQMIPVGMGGPAIKCKVSIGGR
jgi:TldD protein